MKYQAAFFLLILTASLMPQTGRDIIYQVSNLNSLAAGLYEGEVKLSSLKQFGDFGIGTFNQLDGEMIFLDNTFYQVKGNGKVALIDESSVTPFSNVTFFDEDTILKVYDIKGFKSLQEYLDKVIFSRNIFYAFKIEGEFSYVKTRSVSVQSRPYKPLVEVTKDQSVFEFRNVKGTIAGYRFPSFITGINMVGYHFHFLSDDKSGGGHLLECNLKYASVKIDYTRDIFLSNPASKEFDLLNMESDRQAELIEAEK